MKSAIELLEPRRLLSGSIIGAAAISGASNYQDVVAITYNAASGGQTLTISWVKSQTIGSVDLIAAWLQ